MSEWNDIAVIAPTGDIDLASVPALREQVDGLMATGVRRILINCQNVGFIDSTGLAFLLTRARSLLARDGLLSLVGASPQIMRFLQIARLLDILHVTSSEKPELPVLAPGAPPKWSKSFAVRPGVEHLGAYRRRVSDLLEGLSLSRDDRFDVALAVGEALSNAYDHACGARGCTVTVQAYADRVVIEVRDCGCGYEISADEEPPESRERGRGIRLMRMLVDSVEVCRRVDAPGTQVRLIKLLK
ncbi:MAG: anti-sigma factor antagonist [Coriobacteriaceae bacterium]|nr:anti-sigma factor antagonist [Coriobacteriaceae bacterium]